MGNPSSAFGLRIGDRIELVAMGADPQPIAPGSTGVVSWLCDTPGLEQVVVAWDSGRRLALIPGLDTWRMA
jgi:hypothetical protein